MKKQIKKIDILSLAIASSIIAFGLTLLLATVVTVATFVINQVFSGGPSFAEFFASLLGGLVTAVLLAGVNFVLGGFVAWLYNLVVNYTKGVIVELEDEK